MPRRTATPIELVQKQRQLSDITYVTIVDSFIPKAMEAAVEDFEKMPIKDRNPVVTGKKHEPFKMCSKSRLFHKHMNRLKREAGLIS